MKKMIFITVLLIFGSFVICGQSITVSSPSGEDSWVIGSSHNLTWTKSGTMNENVKIRLYNETGVERIIGITDRTANNGIFRDWIIPDSVPAGRYVIRVKTVDNLVYDDSEPFHIVESTVPTGRLEVTLPNSSTVIYTTRYWISVLWNKYGELDDNVSIEVFPEGSSTGSTLIVASTPIDSDYHWMSPGSIGVGRYYVRVRTVDGTVYGDSEVFEVVEPAPLPPTGSMTITSPDSSASWDVNTSRQIVWRVSGEMNDRVRIIILNESGAMTLAVTDSTENDGEHTFLLPSTHPAGRHNVRISTIDNLVMATSEVFNIVRPDDVITESPRKLRFIKITSPEKNSVWIAGKDIKIFWKKIGDQYNRVKIELQKERAFRTFATIVSDTQNNGIFKWRIPRGMPAGRYVIKITTLDNRTKGASGIFRIKARSGLYKKY